MFFSSHLRPPERKYSAFDRELLALYLTIRHFRYFLEGRHFTAFTDHKPLLFAFDKVSDPWSARQQHHLTYISEYSTCVQHISGKSNKVADAILRPTISAMTAGINYAALAAAQEQEVRCKPTALSSLVWFWRTYASAQLTLRYSVTYPLDSQDLLSQLPGAAGLLRLCTDSPILPSVQ